MGSEGMERGDERGGRVEVKGDERGDEVEVKGGTGKEIDEERVDADRKVDERGVGGPVDEAWERENVECEEKDGIGRERERSPVSKLLTEVGDVHEVWQEERW